MSNQIIQWFKYASPQSFYPLAGRMIPWFVALAVLFGIAGLWVSFFVAPTDATQSEAYRIIFIHVPTSWLSMFIYLIMAAWAGIGLALNTRPAAKRLAGQAPFVRAIVPLDGSDRAEEALAAARTLFGKVHARLTLVHVVHPMSAVAGVNLKRDPAAEVVREYLEPLAARTASETLEVRHEVKVDSNVARVLLESVEAHDAELVVIAGQGLSGVQRFLVGSVADKLIRTAAVPVLVVPA